jgi:predicted nucleic acid-binding protein
LTRTFLDAGILIAAVRGQAKEAARALAILEDPERSVLTSDFLSMEVLPKAISSQRSAEVALYERYVARAHSIPVSAALVAQASLEACACGLAVLDALHLTCAKAGGAEEFITTDNPTQPLFRATGMVITPLILPSLKMSSPT